MEAAHPRAPVSKILPAAPLALLAAGLLGACAPTAPPDPEAAAVAEARPAAPTGDPVLDGFLAALAANVDLEDADALAAMLDPDGLARALAAAGGAGARERVVAEALGLRGPGGAVPLDAVRVVTFRSVEPGPGDRLRVSGDVRRDDGATVPIGFLVERQPDGSYHVVVPDA